MTDTGAATYMRLMRLWLLFCALGCVLGISTTADPSAAGRPTCRSQISGGTRAEQRLATHIVCALHPFYVTKVRLTPAPKIGRLPPPPDSLRLLVGVSSGAAENIPPGARVRWEADLLAGAIRDSFESHDLRHVAQCKVAAPPDASGHAALVEGGTIGAVRVVPRPWQGATVDETDLGHGIASWPKLATTLAALDHSFGAHSVLRRHQPLGEAPYVRVETSRPREFLSGAAIKAYLAALRLRDGRYEGVFILLTKAGAPLWTASTTARGVDGSNCGVFNTSASRLAGRGQHPASELPDQSAPAAEACAAAGIPFS